MKTKALFVSLILLILFLFIACDGENAFRQEEAICKVGDRYFISVQDAINYVTSSSKAVDQNHTIKLIRDVTASDIPESQRTAIKIPAGVTADLKIDLDGHTYEFASKDFFSVLSNCNVEISNGKAVISNTVSSSASVFSAGKGSIVISNLIISDGRTNPKAADISGTASITVKASSDEKTSLKGSFALSGSAKLMINSGTVAFMGISEPADATGNILISGGSIRNTHELNNRITEAVDAVSEETRNEVKRDIVHGPVEAHKAKVATCTEPGNSEYYICKDTSCGKYFSDKDCLHEIDPSSVIIPTTGHSMQTIAAKEASCTEEGNIEYYQCSVCQNYYKDKNGTDKIDDLASVVIGKLQHSVTHHEPVESSCTVKGHDGYYQCNNCQKYYTDETGTFETDPPKFRDLLEHDWVWTADADNHEEKCTVCKTVNEDSFGSHVFTEWQQETGTEGTWVRRCTKCNYPQTATQCVFTDYDEKKATCTEKGNIAYSQCDLHGDYYLPDHTAGLTAEQVFIPATGHTPGSEKWESDSKAHYHICSVCGEEFDKANHNKVFTSVDSSYHSSKCSVCDHEFSQAHHTMTENWAMTGEAYVAEKYCQDNCGYSVTTKDCVITKVDAKAADCTNPGNTAYAYCTAPDGTTIYFTHDGKALTSYEEVYIKPNGHTADLTYDASYHWGTCSVCGAIINKATHQYSSSWSVADETATRKCDSCEHVQTTEGATDIIEVPAVESTCTSKGNIKYYTCVSVFGNSMVFNSDKTAVISRSATITPMKAHQLVKTERKEATCYEAGNEEYWACSVCGQLFADEKATVKISEVKVIEQLKHVWSENYSSNDSYHWQYCLNTGCEEKNLYNPHKPSDWVITEPKKTAERHCTECGYKITASFVFVPAVAPTSEKEGCIDHYYSAEHNLYMNTEGTSLVRKKDVTLPKLPQ